VAANDFYVYGLFRPNGIICYIGKGHGRRCKAHFSRTHNSHLRAIITMAGGDLPLVIIRSGLTEVTAFEIERAFISAIGRKEHGGPLVNMTDGGLGGSGRRQSEEERAMRRAVFQQPEVRARMSAAHIGKPSARKGKKSSEETKEKLRISHLGHKPSSTANKNASLALTRRWADPTNRETQRQIQLKRYSDPAERRRTGDAISAALNTLEGKQRNVERMRRRYADPAEHQKIAAANSERFRNPAEREKMSIAIKEVWRKRRSEEASYGGS
jgi:hypothetical protein